jgi:hypothetical protein
MAALLLFLSVLVTHAPVAHVMTRRRGHRREDR